MVKPETDYPQFLARLEADGGSLHPFVKQEFDDYLKCGRLEHGFLRAKCDACSHEHLVAFSCKRRGFCPSCGARSRHTVCGPTRCQPQATPIGHTPQTTPFGRLFFLMLELRLAGVVDDGWALRRQRSTSRNSSNAFWLCSRLPAAVQAPLRGSSNTVSLTSSPR